MPVSAGGDSGEENTVLACGMCNHAKGVRVFKDIGECRAWLADHFSKSKDPKHLWKLHRIAATRGESPQVAALTGIGIGIGIGNEIEDGERGEGTGEGTGETPRTPLVRPERRTCLHPGWDWFWSPEGYPRREGTAKAQEAFHKHVCRRYRGCPRCQQRQTESVPIQAIQSGVAAWRPSEKWTPNAKGETFIPLPATWLNQHRWEDTPVRAKPSEADKIREWIERGESDDQGRGR